MEPRSTSSPAARTGDRLTLLLALLVAAAFAFVLLPTVDFPLKTHADEGSKVVEVLSGRNNFAHPLLMLQLARAANAVAGIADPQALVELGRGLAVLAGALAVLATFLLAREVLPTPAALAATVAMAVTPLVTVHARYFKEDIFALPFILLALAALIRLLETPTRSRAVLLGIAIGLAAAAKYVAALVLPFAVVVLLLQPLPGLDPRRRRRLVGLVALVAVAVFVAVQLPALWEFSRFRSALAFNLSRAGQGHDVRVPVTLTYGLFHLRESLVPGLGLPLLIIGILGLAAPWLAPPPRRAPLLILAAFAVLWYGLHELSPLKPFPGYPRYMLPLAPLLIILGAAFIYELARRMVGATSGLLAAAAMLAAALPALYLSLRINGPAQEDPRAVVPDAVSISAPRTGFDHYTRFARAEAEPSAPIRPTAADADLFVTSSFAYGRFLQFGAGPGQPERTRAKAAYYAEVFRRPYLEVTNGRPSYAFFNPVLRIVALAGQAERLAPIAAAIRARAPGLSVRLVEAGPSAP